MKRILALALVIAMICVVALTITSCGAKVECDACGKEYYENQGKTIEMFGEKGYFCPDCAEDLDALGDLFG